MTYGLVGLFDAFAKFSDSHPLGLAGCFISFCGGCFLLNVTMAIQALISYERRKVITSVSIATFSSRVYILLLISIVILFGFWILMYTKIGQLRFVSVRTSRNSSDIQQVCLGYSAGVPGIAEIIFAITELIIPGIIIIYNYW